jgi:hypothetical protein
VLVGGYGGQGVLEALTGMDGIEVEKIAEVTPEAARRCQALVITQNRSGVGDETVARALHGWIEAGGAVLTTHDAVGYRTHPAIAPEIAVGVDHIRSSTMRTTDSGVLPTGLRDKALVHGFYDHVLLKAGEKAQVLASDEVGRPVVVAGMIGRGRYVASGIAFGLNADTQEQAPGEQETALLRAIVGWLVTGR